MNKQEYLNNPCRQLSIPYWKAKVVTVPAEIMIVHQEDYLENEYKQFSDELYFRLIHDLKGIQKPCLQRGYSLYDASAGEFAEHINQCYEGAQFSESEFVKLKDRSVYCSSLWLAVKEDASGEIAATGIGELDRECNEGILEWIQVSEKHRRKGLGIYIVNEMLWRMKDIAHFATVSGKCNNPTKPEKLYRRCGFRGSDVWHVLREAPMK